MNPELRALFPGATERVYLDVAARGLTPTPVADVVKGYLDECVHGVSDKDDARRQVDETRAAFARMVGAEADEIAITKNVSEGLNVFTASLPWERGDNVVFCPELEHPNNIFLWYNLERRHGVEVRAIAPDGPEMPVEAMRKAMDERTRVVTFPTISFAPGLVTDVRALTEAAHAVGALTLADAAQSIGALQTDVRELGVDALAVASQKCLFSLYGVGFLYVRGDLAEELVPVHAARYSVDLEGAHETAYSTAPIRYQPGARRFDIGNYNYSGIAAVRRALALIEEIGVAAIERHVCRLGARLAAGLHDLGLPVVGGRERADRAHIVSVGELGKGRHYTADDPVTSALHEHLSADGIKHSLRAGTLRFAVAAYNDDADIDRVVASTEAFLGTPVA